MSKSKGRRLAEWLRNLDTNSQPAGGGIKDGTISTAKLADDAVTSAKIADSAVATAHLADTGVTFGKLHSALVVTESDAISSNDNDTTIATSAAIIDHVATEVAALVDSAPGALNTLNELAAAVNDDASFSTTITNSIALKAPLASPALTGTPTAPTASSGTNTTQLATTAFVTAATSGLATDSNVANKAPINSPTFTGTPAAPTASAGTNTTQIATTAFVTTATNGLAALAGPTFTGTPAAPTASAGTNTTQIATTAFVTAAVAAGGGGVDGISSSADATAITIDSSERVGIGATSPGGILHIKSDDNGVIFQSSSSSNSRAQIFFQNSSGTTTGKIAVDPDGGNANVMAFSTGSSERMRIDNTGAVAIGGSAIGTRAKSLSVVGEDNSSTIASKTSAYDTVFSVLPWSSSTTYLGIGTYYDDGNWVHASDNATSALLALAGSGVHWYASSGSTVNHDVVTNAPLWNSTGQWDGDINTTYDINTGKVAITNSNYDSHLELNRSSEQWRFSPSTDGSLDIRRIGGTGTARVDVQSDLALLENSTQYYGGFGAATTGGTTNWNDTTNARAGNGYTLLLGTHTNGPGSSAYFHPFSFEYINNDGSGNMTQLAIPYRGGVDAANETMWMRSRYSGTWTGWVKVTPTPPATGNYGTVKVNDDRGVSWAGYAIRDDWVFMSNGAGSCGIYNDTDNEWAIKITRNAQTSIYHNGSQKGYTYDSGWRVTGNLLATSDVYAYYSDLRLKDKTGKIENALDKVGAIETFYYTHNDKAIELGYEDKKQQVGVSAQSVEAVMPEVVHLAPIDDDGEGNSVSGEEYKTVNYARLVPLLIESIKELRAEVEELKRG
mgnify:CR=1 FL=1